jgi:hypothetical protein
MLGDSQVVEAGKDGFEQFVRGGVEPRTAHLFQEGARGWLISPRPLRRNLLHDSLSN